MDLKSPGNWGTYINLVKDKLKFTGKKEMSSYFLKNIEFIQMENEIDDEYNKGSYVRCLVTLGRRLLSIMVSRICNKRVNVYTYYLPLIDNNLSTNYSLEHYWTHHPLLQTLLF